MRKGRVRDGVFVVIVRTWGPAVLDPYEEIYNPKSAIRENGVPGNQEPA